MNFSDSIKKEITSKFNKETHCKKAFLSGFLRGEGVLFEQDGQIGLELRCSNTEAKSLIVEYVKSLYGIVPTSKDGGTGKKQTLTIYGQDTVDILEDLQVFKIVDSEYAVNFDLYSGVITQKDCCLRAFFRGLFLASGSCTVPSKEHGGNTKYHLELSFSHSATAQATAEKLRKFDIDCKITRRKERFIVYVKSAEAIKDFLAFLPAPISVIKFMDLMIEREISNRTNRQNNCIVSNIGKQVDASIKQVEAIKKLQNSSLWATISTDLKTTANARVEFSEDTLLELAQKLNVSKSCLNHRLRKIVDLASRL